MAKWTVWTHPCCKLVGIKNIKHAAKKTFLHMGGSPLDIPKDNLVLLRDHPEGRHKIQDNYKWELFMVVSKHKDPNVYIIIHCVGIWCLWSINNNSLTWRNHPMGIVGILILQIHQPLKLFYPFSNQKRQKMEMFKTLLINICMAPGLRPRPIL